MDHDNDVVNNVCSMNFFTKMLRWRKRSKGNGSFWTAESLRDYLLRNNVHFGVWGKEAFNALLDEVRSGISLQETEEGIVWVGPLASVEVEYKGLLLYVDKKVTPTGSMQPKSRAARLDIDMAPGDNPEAVIASHLGRLGIKGKILIRFISIQLDQPTSTKTYPGLLRQRIVYKFEVTLSESQYKPSYSLIHKDSTIHYAWKKILAHP